MSRHAARYFRAAGLAVSLAALASAAAMASEPGVAIQGAWMRFIIPARPAGGYFTLRNATGAAKLLTGASSPACAQLMLHQTMRQSGSDSMQMVMSVAVPARGSLSFAPGGYHLMCMQPGAALRPGASVPVTLRFGDGGTLTVPFPVRGAGQ